MKNPAPSLQTSLATNQRMAMLGRMRMAQWMAMKEEDFASEIKAIETDPLFRRLMTGSKEERALVRRQGWPSASMASGFFEVKEGLTGGHSPVDVEAMLARKRDVADTIRSLDLETFENVFLKETEGLNDVEAAQVTGLSEQKVRSIREFLLDLGIESEFFGPKRNPALSSAFTCLADLSLEDGEPKFYFRSPHWGRGPYSIRYDEVESWKKKLGREGSGLNRLLKRIETVNLRQNTMFRILTTLASVQAEFLKTRKMETRSPISLRMLSRRLALAPSTVSRALSGRSVALPWGEEVPLISLVPGRREVLRSIFSAWREDGSLETTDAALARRLLDDFRIKVSRRTVNAVRHEGDR